MGEGRRGSSSRYDKDTHTYIYVYIYVCVCAYVSLKKYIKNKSVHDRKTSVCLSSFGIHPFSDNTPYMTMLTEVNIHLSPNVKVKNDGRTLRIRP